jgi:hypothetical protein
MYGELPTSPVVFAACDSAYFIEHGPAFVYSADDVGKDVHIHVVNPTDEVLSLAGVLNSTTKSRFTITFNDLEMFQHPFNGNDGMIRTYYACLRFLVAPTILQHAGKVLILDIDGVIMNEFDFPTKFLGYFPREPLDGTQGWEQEGTRVAAGAVYYDKSAMPVAKAVAEEMSEMELKWFADQIALSRVLGGLPKDQVHHFDSQFMDWEFIEGTTIWTGKGPRKYDNPTYVKQKDSYNTRLEDLNIFETVILKPRLDLPFKKFGLEVANKQLPEIRTHWNNVVTEFIQGVTLIVEMPRWTFNNTIQNYFSDECVTYAPHVEKHNFKGNDNTLYYMQTVFPWLFTVDPKGWAGGAEYVDTFKPNEIETCGTSFDKLAKYVKSGGSKFAQPKTLKSGLPERFIFVPLQLPHDETIKWHSDVTVPEFVEKLCEWADSSEDNPMVLFKGHPVNLGVMEPLFNIIKQYKNVAYVNDISIQDAISAAEATYVINSGVGQEAMLLDASVVAFGRCDYQGAVIPGKINDLDFTYDAVKHDDKEARKSLYRKWYKWYLELTVDSNE